MILIGSRALALRGLGIRPPKDFDFVCTEAEAHTYIGCHDLHSERREGDKLIATDATGTHYEFDIAGGSNDLLRDLVEPDGLPSLDLLFTIKKAHRHKKDSPHFWKTLSDYHLMKRAGADVRPEYHEFFKMREAESYAAQKHPKLNVGKAAFFSPDQGVTYVYDHDSIHDAVALQEKPAYRYFLSGPVNTSKRLFDDSPHSIQINSVIEESAVLMIERSLVPYSGVLTPTQAWRYAFSKVCTTIASGWWRSFAYENALECIRLARPDEYWTRFQVARDAGQVRLTDEVT